RLLGEYLMIPLRMRAFLSVILAICLSATVAALPRSKDSANRRFPQQIMIIRHSEKTGEDGDVHLSKRGVERAEVLYKLFLPSQERPKPFPTPDFVIAASNGKSSHRPLETVSPLAERLKLPVDMTYDSKLLPDPDALKSGRKVENDRS